jgi:hypothetical protein
VSPQTRLHMGDPVQLTTRLRDGWLRWQFVGYHLFVRSSAAVTSGLVEFAELPQPILALNTSQAL